MPSKPLFSTEAPNNEIIHKWFDDFICHIQADQFLMTENVASEETRKFYNDLILGNEMEMHSSIRQANSVFFIKNIIQDYIAELKSFNKTPLKLSMGLSDSKILVWAVVNDDDEDMEDALLLSEAKVNSKYYNNGFYLNSTIIEKSDDIPTPPHYHPIIK